MCFQRVPRVVYDCADKAEDLSFSTRNSGRTSGDSGGDANEEKSPTSKVGNYRAQGVTLRVAAAQGPPSSRSAQYCTHVILFASLVLGGFFKGGVGVPPPCKTRQLNHEVC